jgi:hypothetical protein
VERVYKYSFPAGNKIQTKILYMSMYKKMNINIRRGDKSCKGVNCVGKVENVENDIKRPFSFLLSFIRIVLSLLSFFLVFLIFLVLKRGLIIFVFLFRTIKKSPTNPNDFLPLLQAFESTLIKFIYTR